MIGTEQERAALMAAVEAFGNARADAAVALSRSKNPDDADDRYDEANARFDAIRAMLAPDDAVVIPRVLAEAAAENLEMSANEFRLVDMIDAANERQADAEALRAVLRGEATR